MSSVMLRERVAKASFPPSRSRKLSLYPVGRLANPIDNWTRRELAEEIVIRQIVPENWFSRFGNRQTRHWKLVLRYLCGLKVPADACWRSPWAGHNLLDAS